MTEQYKNNAFIPKPNRFLVEEEDFGTSADSSVSSSGEGFSHTLIVEKETLVPAPNTNENKDLIIDNEELMNRLRQLFPELVVDIENLGTVVRDYSYMKSSMEQLQDKISMLVSEGSEMEILGVGGLDGLYTKIEKMTAEIEIMKSSISLAVESTDYDSMETYINNTMGGYADSFKNNVKIITEQMKLTVSEINVLRSKIELRVGEVDAEGVYTNANNQDQTSSWSNTVGVYNANLRNFEYTDATGWVGTGEEGDPYGLRFNANQYLTLTNRMKDDTVFDQSFTIESFLTLKNGANQKLTNLGSGMYLTDEIGMPRFSMNTGANEISYTPDQAFPINSMIHVTYVFDAQLRVIQVYLNGVLCAGQRVWKSDESLSMPPTIVIGEGFTGDMFTFRIYDKRLTGEEIFANFEQTVEGNGYSRDGLIVCLEGKKAMSLSKAIDNSRAEVKILKDSIVSKVSREEMDQAIAISSGYVVIFSNENQTFATEYDGSLSESIIIETDIDIFKGSTRIGAIISEPVLKNHLGISMEYGTIEVSNPTTNSAGHFKWTIPSGTNIPADYGWVELNFDMNGVMLLKKITWSKAKRGMTGPTAPANYKVDVLSSNGNIFMNGQVSTILYVNIYYGDDEVTDEINDARCIWTRTSSSPASDAAWNAEHSVGSKHIYIDINDIYERATFGCDLTEV